MMSGPLAAGVDTKWKDAAARPFKVAFSSDWPHTHAEKYAQSDAAGSIAGLPVHG
jgi:hypothetical protein